MNLECQLLSLATQKTTVRNDYRKYTKARYFIAKNMSDINRSMWKNPNSEPSPAVLKSQKMRHGSGASSNLNRVQNLNYLAFVCGRY